MDLTGTQGQCPSQPALAEIACLRVDAPTQFILQRRQAFLLRRIFGRWEPNCGVEVWRGGLDGAYLLPTLSSVGASLAPPCFRFHTPLIEPDVRICRIRLSEKTHAIAAAIACDAVCNF